MEVGRGLWLVDGYEYGQSVWLVDGEREREIEKGLPSIHAIDEYIIFMNHFIG